MPDASPLVLESPLGVFTGQIAPSSYHESIQRARVFGQSPDLTGRRIMLAIPVSHHRTAPDAFFWKCYGKHPRQKFSLKVGTIFEHSPSDWKSGALPHAILVNCKNGISSHEVGRALGVTQKITWFMLHRIRPAIYTNTSSKICGEVEVDETFIGGKARNVHPAQRKRRITATGGADKAAHGFLKRGREVRAVAIPTFSATRLMEK